MAWPLLLLLLLCQRVWMPNASVLSNTTAMFFHLYVCYVCSCRLTGLVSVERRGLLVGG